METVNYYPPLLGEDISAEDAAALVARIQEDVEWTPFASLVHWGILDGSGAYNLIELVDPTDWDYQNSELTYGFAYVPIVEDPIPGRNVGPHYAVEQPDTFVIFDPNQATVLIDPTTPWGALQRRILQKYQDELNPSPQ